MYHGANRLGGNSLLAALYSGNVAADDIFGRDSVSNKYNFEPFVEQQNKSLRKVQDSSSPFPVMYIRDMLAETMKKHLGIVRTAESLSKGIEDIEYDLSVSEKIKYDGSVSAYSNYSLKGILTLARAVVSCAVERKESRGAHYRSDFPSMSDEYAAPTLVSYDDGEYNVKFDKEELYES
jgi:succinate dehydrogenase / fumarate reductase flavoprotein subunit